MNIYGDVHTNANLYAGYNTLGFYQNVTAVGDFSNAFKSGDGNHSGTPAAPNWNNGGKDAQLKTQIARQEVLGAAPSTITDDIHKLIEVPSSTSNDADALSNRRLYNQADYRILMNSSNKDITYDTINGSVTVPAKGSVVSYARNGNSATASAISNPKPSDPKIITVSDASINDGRQKGTVLLNTIDTGALSAAIQTNSNATQAIVYAADVAYSDSAQTAVRLKNGATLKQDLTIASQNAVYINGDYNTGKSPSSDTGGQPPSASDVLANNSTYNSFTEGSGYDRFSSMVAADAVTILSNGWVDANSSSSSRKATATTVNSAIISGNVATKGGTYSGGVENFPRFLEDWGSIPFTYYGSFIQLYNSKQFTAPWGGTTYYQAPIRRWFFDMQFLTRPAPGVATATAKQRGAWFRNTPAASSL